MRMFIVFLFLGVRLAHSSSERDPSVPCYVQLNNAKEPKAQRCQPPFVNAAYNRVIVATNTCGVSKVTEYCMQTGVTGDLKQCAKCDDSHPDTRHPPEFLSDFNNNTTKFTSWQSETMLEGIQYPNVVNLTLHLKKSFDITYVNLRFQSPRPESFAIYKRTTENGPWIPYQFYSASCEKTYGLKRRQPIDKEDKAVCTNVFSDISPLTGGSVAFSTLEGRPNMFDFLKNQKLQEWVTATDIRIVLTRMNTFGDEVFGDETVLKSYFYAISDFAVGARCKCNGHASKCRKVRDQSLEERLECVCEHFTTGPDCEKCLPFYNDQPWGRATDSNVNECKACNCSDMSDSCVFDQELFRLTGHGGRCTECRDNTDGVHCELCKANYYRRENRCISCDCSPIGSRHSQCDSKGQCPCKPGVSGLRCNKCLENFYDYGENGCRPCACLPAGSQNNEPRCDSLTGLCSCKQNVDGRQCDKCKPGFFGLSEKDPFGCMSCFCYGHSSQCTSASDFYAFNITSTFDTGNEKWTAASKINPKVETQYNGISHNLGVSSEAAEAVYFLAPGRYLGDQRLSYNQFLSFDLRIGDIMKSPSSVDIVLEGRGKSVSTHIYAQSNPTPGTTQKSFAFRIHENPTYMWTPRLKSTEFIAILSNLTALKIRATYNDQGVGFIDNIKMGTASQNYQGDSEATWVETCTCPIGYIGQFCESCVQGYKRDIVSGGSFARCVPCECNNHSDSCDVNTGHCICQDNTVGNFCERCYEGYYGDATEGKSTDCMKCPCPDEGPCIQLMNGDVVCTDCKLGQAGNLCDDCQDGYYGDPMGNKTGKQSDCRKCTCNGNIDPNAVNNCNRTTGECLKCIRNTEGFHCEQCLTNYYNNTYGLCSPCNCNPSGTVPAPSKGSNCDQNTGQCICLPNVVGQKCDQCAAGFWDIASGTGCQPCECFSDGSINYICDETSGRCQCKPGISGRTCNVCEKNYYGFSETGCTACLCDPVGSIDQQCDSYGNCPCKDNVDGRRCDRCMENKYDMSAGCLDCPKCYNLVQHQVSAHRAQLRDLKLLIEQTSKNPSLFNDAEFFKFLSEVNSSIANLLDDAKKASVGDGTVGHQLENLNAALKDVLKKCGDIGRNIASASKATKDSEVDIQLAERAIENADKALKNAENYIAEEGQAALKKAVEALGKFGHSSQQMTDIAQKATELANKQTKEAQMIEDLANHALATSKEAYRLANVSLSMPLKTFNEVEKIKRDYDDASLLFTNTLKVADSTLSRANEAREEVIKVSTSAEHLHPSIDFENWKMEAEKVIEKANNVKDASKLLLSNNKDLMEKVDKQTERVNELLEEGKILNDNTAEYLAEVDAAKEVAEKAVKFAEDTLKEANQTLQTLEEFEKLISSKDAAQEALKQVPAIREKMDRAITMTQQARQALQDVEIDVEEAWKTVQNASRTLTAATQNAQNLKKKSDETKAKAADVKKQAEDLDMEQQTTKDKVTQLETRAEADQDSADNALQESDAVKQKAEDALKQISSAHDLVTSINNQLNNLGAIDLERLNALEKLLDQAEKNFNDSNVHAEINNLLSKAENLEGQISRYEIDIIELRKAVQNVEEISNSLPEGCFKNIILEPGVSSG